MKHSISLYFYKRWRKFLFLLLWQLIVFVTLYLENIAIKKLLYTFLISTAFFIILLIADYVVYLRRRTALLRMQGTVADTLENLPKDVELLEQEYQLLLKKLFACKRKSELKDQKWQADKTEFLTIWTHQVKTPLTALQLAVMDIEEPLQGELKDRLFEIEQYCDMILQYLRSESESTDYVFAEYSAKDMVSKSVKYFARTFIRKGISVQIQVPDDAMIITDEKWLVFVLKQIISNALKYTKEGSITISMPKEQIICITDTGCGIAKEDLPRIFERGYTGYNGRKEQKSTGLGLFLVDSILQKLNGTVRIESTVGEGTSVYLVLQKTT